MVTRALVFSMLLLSHNSVVIAIEPLYNTVAAYVGVPPQILYAMSKAESGMVKDKRFGPWPWTLNIAGVAKRYEDRQSMFKGLMEALGTGEQRIDIGPLQVNWYWQFEALGSPWRITDPAVNIKVAAQILREHYDRSGDWWDAVGRYHRPADTPKDKRIADRYRQRVRHFYDKTKTSDADANVV